MKHYQSPWLRRIKNAAPTAVAPVVKRVLRGTTLVRWTYEQIRKHNILTIGPGKELIVSTEFDPSSWSLEEGVVAYKNPWNTFLEVGDRVLVDYVVFTAGMEPGVQLTDETRVFSRDHTGVLFRATDGTTGDATEILARVEPGDNLTPYPGTCFVEPPPKGEWKQRGLLQVQEVEDRDTKPWVGQVKFSSIPGVTTGMRILCEAGMSQPVNWHIPLEYIEATYILGFMDNHRGIQLF